MNHHPPPWPETLTHVLALLIAAIVAGLVLLLDREQKGGRGR